MLSDKLIDKLKELDAHFTQLGWHGAGFYTDNLIYTPERRVEMARRWMENARPVTNAYHQHCQNLAWHLLMLMTMEAGPFEWGLRIYHERAAIADIDALLKIND